MIERPLSEYYLAKMGRVASIRAMHSTEERAQLRLF